MREAWNGREFDRYSSPKEYDTIVEAAKVIQSKRMIYKGMSNIITIKAVWGDYMYFEVFGEILTPEEYENLLNEDESEVN